MDLEVAKFGQLFVFLDGLVAGLFLAYVAFLLRRLLGSIEEYIKTKKQEV